MPAMSIITKTCWINTEIIITKRMGKDKKKITDFPKVTLKYPQKEFKAIWKDLDPRIKHQLEEHYRILKREHFNSGRGKRRKKDARFRFEGILKIFL